MDKYSINSREYLLVLKECAGLDPASLRFKQIQQEIINTKNGALMVDFADRVEQADLEKIEAALIKNKDLDNLNKFIKKFDSYYPNRVQKLMIESGNPKYVRNLSLYIQQADSNQIYKWLVKHKFKKHANEVKIDIDIKCLAELNQHFHNFGKDATYKSCYQKMLKSKSARYVYEFSTRVSGIDYNQVAKVLLNLNSGMYIAKFAKVYAQVLEPHFIVDFKKKLIQLNDFGAMYIFACDVPYTSCKDLENAIKNSENCQMIYLFARDVYNANVTQLGNKLIELGNPEYIYKFARDVENDMMFDLQKAIINIGNIKYVALFSNIYDADYEMIERLILDTKNPDVICEYMQYADGFDVESFYQSLIMYGKQKHINKFESILRQREEEFEQEERLEYDKEDGQSSTPASIGGVIKGGRRLSKASFSTNWLEQDDIVVQAQKEYSVNGRSRRFVELEDSIVSTNDGGDICSFIYSVPECDVVKLQTAIINLGEAKWIYNLIFLPEANIEQLKTAIYKTKDKEYINKFENKYKEIINKRKKDAENHKDDGFNK